MLGLEEIDTKAMIVKASQGVRVPELALMKYALGKEQYASCPALSECHDDLAFFPPTLLYNITGHMEDSFSISFIPFRI